MHEQAKSMIYPEKALKIGVAITGRDFKGLEAWLAEYKKPRGLGVLARAMDNKGPSAVLCDAAASGWVEAVRLLLPEADLRHAVAVAGNEKERERAGRDGNDLSGIKAESGVLYTALGFACLNGRVECAKILLESIQREESGASADSGRGEGGRAGIPCRRLVKFIYGSYGSDLALHFAAEQGLHVAVETLALAGEALNEKDRSGMTALFAAVASKPGKGAEQRLGREEVVRKLCALGASLDEPCGEKGKTALVLAVEQEDLTVAKILLQAGASAKVEMKGGQTCLGIVASGVASEMREALAAELLSHGAYPWRSPKSAEAWESPLAVALASGNINIARSIALAAAKAQEDPGAESLPQEEWRREMKLANGGEFGDGGFADVAQILRRARARQEEALAQRQEQELIKAAKKMEEEGAENAEKSLREIRDLAGSGAAGVDAAIAKIQERLSAIEAEAKELRGMIREISEAGKPKEQLGENAALLCAKAEAARGRLNVAAELGGPAPSRRVVHETRKPG